MLQPADSSVLLDVVRRDEHLVPSLMLLLSDETPAEQLARVTDVLRAYRCSHDAFASLITALRGNTLVGSVWGQSMPGRSVCLWMPRLVGTEPRQTAIQLLGELDRRLCSRRMDLIQAVLPKSRDQDLQLLAECGFEHAADLAFLFSECGPSDAVSSVSELSFEPFRVDQRERMLALIEATYEGTLDVPVLNGVRKMHDVFEGYWRTGVADPSHWFFVCRDHADVGCLLLANHPDQGQWELVYMGLAPLARGRGWGQVIVEFAKRFVAASADRRLVLAVDSANEPALRVYGQAGFAVCDRRDVMLKIPGCDRLSRPAN